ncbi:MULTISPECIES: effector-associated constant component EACC1 [unclassified Streptomyces]|nr:hypothetical protein [Streptomyces sp. PsTaAH-130]MYU66803.1 hypothetical protein [Streptomyces sp. SID69]
MTRRTDGGVMDVRLDAEGPEAADLLRSLHGWLRDDQSLRGRLGLRERPPDPGALGPVLDAVVVALGPGGAATALATGVIAWLRGRRGEVRMKVTLEDGRSLELTARRVAGLDATALRQQTADLAALLNGEGGTEANRDGGTGLESSGRDSNGALEPGGRDRNAAPDPGGRGGGAGPGRGGPA